MEYAVILLEGIITFLSPCMLPMLPIYISYFAGQENDNTNKLKTLKNALGFVIGFTIIFTLLAILSASLGSFLKSNMYIVNVILGILVIVFGINLIGIIKLPFVNNTKGIKLKSKNATFISSIIFGVIFSITWTPCVGAFLGTALSIILVNGHILKGTILILIYCIGLGIPFIISAILIDKLKNTFNVIKKHYKTINIMCGIFLCIIGVLMITGLIDKYFSLIM